MNEDAVVFFDRFAVWVATMVDPARFVAADFSVDYFAVIKAEIECMRALLVVRGIAVGDALTGVFDDPGAFCDELGSVNTAAMHAGETDFESRRSFFAESGRRALGHSDKEPHECRTARTGM